MQGDLGNHHLVARRTRGNDLMTARGELDRKPLAQAVWAVVKNWIFMLLSPFFLVFCLVFCGEVILRCTKSACQCLILRCTPSGTWLCTHAE